MIKIEYLQSQRLASEEAQQPQINYHMHPRAFSTQKTPAKSRSLKEEHIPNGSTYFVFSPFASPIHTDKEQMMEEKFGWFSDYLLEMRCEYLESHSQNEH